ncbi:MAG: hypothetical protein V1736_08490 [Pseudomonadota bacterium]
MDIEHWVLDIRYWVLTYARDIIDFQIKLLGALSVGDVRTGTIPSLLPSQKHYLKVYSIFRIPYFQYRHIRKWRQNLPFCSFMPNNMAVMEQKRGNLELPGKTALQDIESAERDGPQKNRPDPTARARPHSKKITEKKGLVNCHPMA